MTRLPALVLATLAALCAVPASVVSAHEHAAASPATAQAPLTAGVIKKVAPAARTMVIKHEALPNGMPAMTMEFGVQDAAWLTLKPGQKIRFAADYVGGAMTVTRLETVK